MEIVPSNTEMFPNMFPVMPYVLDIHDGVDAPRRWNVLHMWERGYKMWVHVFPNVPNVMRNVPDTMNIFLVFPNIPMWEPVYTRTR